MTELSTFLLFNLGSKPMQKPPPPQPETNDLGIPLSYDGSYRINVTLPPRDIVNCIREDQYRRGTQPRMKSIISFSFYAILALYLC